LLLWSDAFLTIYFLALGISCLRCHPCGGSSHHFFGPWGDPFSGGAMAESWSWGDSDRAWTSFLASTRHRDTKAIPMPAPEINIHHVAKLARLALTEEEAVHFHAQLTSILSHIDQLSHHDLVAEPSAHPTPVYDVVREDVSRPGFSQEEALQNAPRRIMNQFQIPKVVE
jgi:aspartyl-tRNA(Asn)/glutamyl-tRNA(Gln) amidotransferase subunit C